MSFYGRHGVLSGQTIELRTVFTDNNDCLVDPDSIPNLYIYDQSVDIDVIDAEITAGTFASALAGPLVTTKLATGFYSYVYSVPSGVTEGTWHDVWVANINGVQVADYLAFKVVTGGSIANQQLNVNEMIIIELDSTIRSLDGTKVLGEDLQISFTTEYYPLYASPDLVRLEIGPWLDYIPDNTLALMLHWASKEADFIRGAPVTNRDRLNFARTKFVIFDAVLRALYLPGGHSRQIGSVADGSKKSLGDLSINKGDSSSSTTAGGIDTETLKYIKDNRQEWFRVLNAAGNIVPGQSLDPRTAIRAQYDPDRRKSGRLHLDPDFYPFMQPSVNFKSRIHGGKRYRGTFADRLSPRSTSHFRRYFDD